MRHSGFIVVVILIISAVLFLPQHTVFAGAAGSAGSSAGGSHGGSSSGGGFSSASRGSSPSSSAGPRNGSSSSVSGSQGKTKGAKTETHDLASLLRHKKADPKAPVVASAVDQSKFCKKGQNCGTCQSGFRNGAGNCAPQLTSCSIGQTWNNYICGPQYWSNSCDAMAAQLEAQGRHMQGTTDPGERLLYQTLQNQYQQCLQRFGLASFGVYGFGSPGLFIP